MGVACVQSVLCRTADKSKGEVIPKFENVVDDRGAVTSGSVLVSSSSSSSSIVVEYSPTDCCGKLWWWKLPWWCWCWWNNIDGCGGNNEWTTGGLQCRRRPSLLVVTIVSSNHTNCINRMECCTGINIIFDTANDADRSVMVLVAFYVSSWFGWMG